MTSVILETFPGPHGSNDPQVIACRLHSTQRKGDTGNYWRLEMAILSLLTATQNVHCIAVSDRQLVLKSTVPSLSTGARDILVPQEGLVAKQTLIPKLAITVFTGSVL